MDETRQAIKKSRHRKRWSVRKLAAEAGVSKATISRVESGRECLASTLDKIRAALGLS
jgi:transcriptional regulator with XRE-family HTH domain